MRKELYGLRMQQELEFRGQKDE